MGSDSNQERMDIFFLEVALYSRSQIIKWSLYSLHPILIHLIHRHPFLLEEELLRTLGIEIYRCTSHIYAISGRNLELLVLRCGGGVTFVGDILSRCLIMNRKIIAPEKYPSRFVSCREVPRDVLFWPPSKSFVANL
jgi:hypothetical protein